MAEIDHVLFISMDTCRADHLGCYGYARNTTPNLDAFAKENILFRNAFTQSISTLPSHTTVFTSLYPGVHQAEVTLSRPMPPSLVTIAEVLKRHGYVTAAFHSGAQLSEIWNVFKGFDTVRFAQSTSIEDTAAMYIDFIAQNTGRKTFAFVHGLDIHFPNYRPGVFSAEEKVDKQAAVRRISNHEHLLTDEDTKRQLSALYDDTLTFFDRHIQRIIDALKAEGMYERTAIAIFGDHGEEMGERMKMAAHHRNLCEEVTRVPLLMRIPGHAKVAVDANSRLIDVMPTVLGALGIDPKTVMQGKDLAPYIRGNEAVDLPVFSEYHSNPYSAISVRTSFFQLICNSKTTLVSKLADKYLRYKFGKKGSTVRKWKFRPASIVKATFRRLLGRVQKDKAFDELVFINFRNSKDKAVLLGTESGEGPVQRLRDMIDQQMRENELLRKTLVKDGPQTVELQDDMRKRLHELGYI